MHRWPPYRQQKANTNVATRNTSTPRSARTRREYDRFVYLLDLFRELKFDGARIYAECPYRVADFGTNAILLRAALDLADLCDDAGLNEEAEVQRARAADEERDAQLWSDELAQYVSLDTRTGEQLLLLRTPPSSPATPACTTRLPPKNTTRCSNAGLRNHALHWPRCAPTHPTTNRSATGAARSGRTSTG